MYVYKLTDKQITRMVNSSWKILRVDILKNVVCVCLLNEICAKLMKMPRNCNYIVILRWKIYEWIDEIRLWIIYFCVYSYVWNSNEWSFILGFSGGQIVFKIIPLIGYCMHVHVRIDNQIHIHIHTYQKMRSESLINKIIAIIIYSSITIDASGTARQQYRTREKHQEKRSVSVDVRTCYRHFMLFISSCKIQWRVFFVLCLVVVLFSFLRISCFHMFVKMTYFAK